MRSYPTSRETEDTTQLTYTSINNHLSLSLSNPTHSISTTTTTTTSTITIPLLLKLHLTTRPPMNDVFDAPPPNFTNQSKPPNPKTPSLNFNPISSNSPVFDKPVYDDDYKGGGEDIFDGVFGIKKNSSSAVPTKKDSSGFDDFDLFGNFDVGKMEVDGKSKDRSSKKKWEDVDSDFSAFDDLMPGFGATNPSTNRETTETGQPQRASVPSTISTSSVIEEPFVVSPTDSYPSHASAMLFTEPLEQIDAHSHPTNRKIDVSSVHGEISDGIHATSKGLFSSYVNNKENDEIHLGTNPYRTDNLVIKEPTGKSSIKISENVSEQKIPASNFREFHQSLFEMPFVSSASDHAFTQNGRHMNASSTETGSHMGRSLNSEDDSEASDEVWLTIKDITLTTLPTRAPPPSRSPPRPQHTTKVVKGYPVQSKDSEVFSSFYHSGQSNWIPQSVHDTVKSSNVPSIDELEDFARDRPQRVANGHDDVHSDEVAENSAAEASAAVKAVMDRAEAKFKQARDVWERKNAAKNGGSQQERDDKIMQDIQKREKQESIECEIEQREKDEKDREERKMEKERAQAQEIEKKREREKGRQAVDRAMKEVRERAAVEARQKAERAAVDKVNAGARERAERSAVQKAQAEARERAATVARERAAKAASEALEMKNAEDKEKAAAVARAETEARTRADRAFVNRATAEARERAASAATRRNQQKSESDFDSTFNASARSDNASSSSDSAFDAQLHNRHMPEKSVHSTSSGTRNASSTRNGVDDLTSFFGATPQSEDLQEVLSESDERRKARLERDQRMQERSEKALADKHERDRHTQWEQAERHRMAESLDFEIKRWAAGKEGNLRALLSTLQYVLWPECGWQPVSIADLITSASVKKVYRKATLCIHPDKVQQKGANLQQKYIAEKVFDLLKEAWNKLNSQELS